jgi:hypothetical protein
VCDGITKLVSRVMREGAGATGKRGENLPTNSMRRVERVCPGSRINHTAGDGDIDRLKWMRVMDPEPYTISGDSGQTGVYSRVVFPSCRDAGRGQRSLRWKWVGKEGFLSSKIGLPPCDSR